MPVALRPPETLWPHEIRDQSKSDPRKRTGATFKPPNASGMAGIVRVIPKLVRTRAWGPKRRLPEPFGPPGPPGPLAPTHQQAPTLRAERALLRPPEAAIVADPCRAMEQDGFDFGF